MLTSQTVQCENNAAAVVCGGAVWEEDTMVILVKGPYSCCPDTSALSKRKMELRPEFRFLC